MKPNPRHCPPPGLSGAGNGAVSEGRGWFRIILGLVAAAALVAVPWWWDAAGALVRAGPLAPAWPWLVPALLGALVVTITLAGPLPSRRRRLERQMAGFEDSFQRRLAAANGVVEPGSWRRALEHRRAAASERMARRGRRLGRGGGYAEKLLEVHWQRIAATLAEREHGGSEDAAGVIPVAGLIDAALRDAGGTLVPADAADSERPREAAPGVERRGSTAPAPAPPRPVPGRRSGEQAAGRKPAPDTEPVPDTEPAPDTGAPETVYEAGAFFEAVQQARESVALEGGVYRVRERLYGNRGEPRRSLRRIAETVITDEKIARLSTAGGSRQARTPVTGDGLNYDRLLAQFPDPPARQTRTRALEEQRVALQADAAVLLASRAAGYSARYVTGSPVSILSTMVLAAGDPLYDDYLRMRRYLLAGPGGDVCSSLPFAAARAALLPAMLDGRRAYLLFAAATRGDATEPIPRWSRETLIERLNLHP